MSQVTGVKWYAMTVFGPKCITGWNDGYYFVQNIDKDIFKTAIKSEMVHQPTYKSLTEFHDAYPEYFL